MEVEHQIDVRTDGIADSLYDSDGATALRTVHFEIGRLKGIPFQRAISHSDTTPRRRVILLTRARAEEPVVGVAGDPIPVLAAKQFEYRHAESLALDIEHGGLDCSQRGAEHRARAPVAVPMELLDERIRPEGIAPDELALQLLKSGHDGQRLPLERRLTDAIDSFIRVKLHEDEVRPRNIRYEGLEAGDLHGWHLAAGRHTGKRLGLKAVGHHLHQLDAMTIRVFDPGLPVAVGAHLLFPDQRHPGCSQFTQRNIDIPDLKANMVVTHRVAVRRTFADAFGKHLEKLGIRNAQVEQPEATVPVKAHHLAHTEFADVEIESAGNILHADGHVGDR